ncbi:hypothetical protein ACJIZ3_010688 [Penstemon smallii]|uniref:Uncharacterized protein n=1 Tax=Penstemon smallii TaxID=265156 RepID=A0ABD3UJ59_9LAMI
MEETIERQLEPRIEEVGWGENVARVDRDDLVVMGYMLQSPFFQGYALGNKLGNTIPPSRPVLCL